MKFDYSKNPTLYVILENREDEKAYLSKYYQSDNGIEIEFNPKKELSLKMEYFDARKTMDYIKRWNKQNMDNDCIVDCHYALIEIKK
ncbi:MAG TPA: hypothetical protein EYN64_06435 [Flavobacteriales bacterium]|nr:hypothetical protein [Flavobacteriales bacterium]